MTWTEQILTQGELELKLVPSIGGRLMDVVYNGASLLFQNPDLEDQKIDLMKLNQLPTRAAHIPFPLWGGEKTWIAPECEWPDGAPYPVLDSGPYTLSHIDANSAVMISRICPQSGLQIRRKITLTSDHSWTLSHHVTNHGTTPRSAGLWSVNMTQSPASYFFRSNPDIPVKTLFGNPEKALSITAGIGEINCGELNEFKLGTHPMTGVVAARMMTQAGAIWLISRTETLEDTNIYAHGHAVEFYNSGHYNYGELEWHSPMVNLLPGESQSFDLNHQVFLEKPGQSTVEVYQMIESGQDQN